jgi:hypothetical protein
MALSCAELRQRLDADERLDASDVREHAAGCVDCRRALERWRAAAFEMRAWSEESLPPFLHARIMAGLRGGASEGERRGWRAWLGRRPVWASSALAAAFVLVVASVVMLRAPQVAQAPERLGPARGPMSAAQPAPSEHPLEASEGASASGVETKRSRASRSAEETARERSDLAALQTSRPAPLAREAPQRKKQLLESEPKQEIDRGVSLSDDLRASQKEALHRDEPRLRQAEAPREVERAPVSAPPPPQSQVSGGTANPPPPRAAASPAAGELGVTESDSAPREHAAGRAPAPKGDVFKAKAVASRIRARLVPLAGGLSRSVEVSPALLAAGPRLIDVDAQGRPQGAAEPAKPGADRGISTNSRRDTARLSGALGDERVLAPEDRQAIEALGLTSGRYRLERADE